jgi:hypothetical protein
VNLYHVGARAYDPRTARWLQRDPAGAAGGHPNLYLYPRNDPINWFDSGGLQATRKLPPGVSKTKEDCEEILDKIEHKMKELSKDIENAMKGKSPLADLQGQIGKPGGRMCELEQRMHGIGLEWEKYFTSGCDEYKELRARRKDLHTRYGNMQRRIAKWAGQLKDVDASLIRKLIQGLKDPNVQKYVVKFIRRMAKFVPYIGHIIHIIFFIHDWYTGGFWNAVKGLVVQNNSPEMHHTQQGTILARHGGANDEASVLSGLGGRILGRGT